MKATRRSAVWLLLAPVTGLGRPQQLPSPEADQSPEMQADDPRLPNGKLRTDAIAAAEHKAAMKDADQLVELANEIKGELEKAGSFVVPLSTVKKTEEVEKLARKIRGRLKR